MGEVARVLRGLTPLLKNAYNSVLTIVNLGGSNAVATGKRDEETLDGVRGAGSAGRGPSLYVGRAGDARG